MWLYIFFSDRIHTSLKRTKSMRSIFWREKIFRFQSRLTFYVHVPVRYSWFKHFFTNHSYYIWYGSGIGRLKNLRIRIQNTGSKSDSFDLPDPCFFQRETEVDLGEFNVLTNLFVLLGSESPDDPLWCQAFHLPRVWTPLLYLCQSQLAHF